MCEEFILASSTKFHDDLAKRGIEWNYFKEEERRFLITAGIWTRDLLIVFSSRGCCPVGLSYWNFKCSCSQLFGWRLKILPLNVWPLKLKIILAVFRFWLSGSAVAVVRKWQLSRKDQDSKGLVQKGEFCFPVLLLVVETSESWFDFNVTKLLAL